MKLSAKSIALGALIVFAGIQLVRPARNLGPIEPGREDVTVLHPTPPEVKSILARACYDCHSDRTRYPWYAEVQPVGWWLAEHVNDGKRHLNFSRFGSYTPDRAARKMTQTIKETEDGGMPLESYLWIHRDAQLSKDEVAALAAWARSVRQRIGRDR